MGAEQKTERFAKTADKGPVSANFFFLENALLDLLIIKDKLDFVFFLLGNNTNVPFASFL